MQCKQCGQNGRMLRTRRTGFLEKRIYAIFGFYPWICSQCKKRIHLKNRGIRRSDRNRTEFGSPAIRNKNGLHHSG
jgi:DNA-directed RNA polymerase subunit RPC12/RpoP